MKNLLKIGFILSGFVLAFVAFSENANAIEGSRSATAGCNGSGTCGITAHGTVLFGQWDEEVDQ